jgi:hypothetical protein
VTLQKGIWMITQRIRNFKLGALHRTQATASAGLALLMTFAQDIGLGKELERKFSHLKQRRRGYSVSAKILSLLPMIIKGGDRLTDLDFLEADPGLLNLMRMPSVPRPNTMADLAHKFRRRDIQALAEMGLRLGVRALAAAVFFQLQLLAYNLVQVFKVVHREPPWWVWRMKQLRYRLLNIAGVVVRHARTTVLRLSIHDRHFETFRNVFQKLNTRPVDLRL